jgi:hypothetical protein
VTIVKGLKKPDMKLIFILMALPVLASTCKKDRDKNEGTGKLKGKVISSAMCAGPIVQVLNDDSIGEDGWKDKKNNNAQYDNVFIVNNLCKVSLPAKGGIFYFKIDNATTSECMRCMAYDGEPMKGYNITDVSFAE